MLLAPFLIMGNVIFQALEEAWLGGKRRKR